MDFARQSLLEIITGRNNQRFAKMVYGLQKLFAFTGRPIKYSELYLVDALANWQQFDHCITSFPYGGQPFHFDLLRMSYSLLDALMGEICTHDRYGLRRLQASDPVIFDVGAHIGIFSRCALQSNPNATIYAFEPDKDNHHLLSLNLAPFPNIHAINKGILDKKTELELFRSARIDWRSSLMLEDNFRSRFAPEEYSQSYTVEITDLDSFAQEVGLQKLDFLKIVAPGEIELLILKGAQEIIQQYRPQVSIYAYKANNQNVQRFFQELGGYASLTTSDDPNGTNFIFYSE